MTMSEPVRDREQGGAVFWLTGLAGSGKTTLAKELVRQLKRQKSNVIHIDGDDMRYVLGEGHAYQKKDRVKLAYIYSRLCKTLSDQGHDVVCSTISLFKEIHQYNRQLFEQYYEIYIECDMQELYKRNQKGIYNKTESDVVGVSVDYDHPEDCHLILNNSQQDRITEKVLEILSVANRIPNELSCHR